jgi:D-alanyl-D-alanine carboxypeptidase
MFRQRESWLRTSRRLADEWEDNQMTRTILALLLILGHFPLAAAPRRRAVQLPPPAIVTAARAAAEAALQSGVPAVQVAVSQHGRIIYSEAFGSTDEESATAATPGSVMQIASLTKQFTAAAILLLAQRGALTLDDRIEKFVPEFDPRGATITLRHLLTHTSGVTGVPADRYSPVTRAQAIAVINAAPLAFTPGTKWSYSNAGYKLLGYAIESITGKSFAEFVHTELALPLGLIDTGVCGTHNLPLPDGYGLLQGTWTRVPPINPSVSYAAGALCSTARDLARWSHLLATGRVMLPASYATMITPALLADNTVAQFGYALGVYAQTLQGHPVVWHNGIIDPGAQSFLLYLSDQDIAIAVITNAFPAPAGGNPELIAVAIAKAALGTP